MVRELGWGESRVVVHDAYVQLSYATCRAHGEISPHELICRVNLFNLILINIVWGYADQ